MADQPERSINYRKTVAVTGLVFFLFLLAAPYQIYREQEEKIAQLTPKNKLDLYWNADSFAGPNKGAGESYVQYNVTITNRSDRHMNLSFAGNFYFKDRNRKMRRLTLRGEMDPAGLKPVTGATQLSLPGGGTQPCTLIFFLPDPKKYDEDKWEFDAGESVAIMAFDTVTGIKEFFLAGVGYPKGRMEESDLPKADISQAVMMMKVEVVSEDQK